MSTEAHKETLEFQAEVQQILNLMIHSLYSNPEIFLRELVSNAADACDKLRFEGLADDALQEGDKELAIRVAFDREARTVTVSDNGIGMSRQEVMDNIGTIARSGTRKFIEALTGDKGKDLKLIGQFGVGFYSSFVVAGRVTLETRRAGLGAEHGVRWESDGSGRYTLETIERAARGTTVTLHLREGQDEFLDAWRLKAIVRKYSDHVGFPILMSKEGKDEGDERVNQAAALWARAKAEIKPEEYVEFYKHVSHDFEAPLAHAHNRVEGKHEYTSLLYIPARAPFDLWDRDRRHGIRLYVKRVFILDDADHLMPHYLRFVRGVIDSDDLPLNVSREILQHNRQIEAIKAGSVKRVLDLLADLATNEPEKYAGFWKEFGRVLKEGVAEDYANRERLAGLLRFATTHADAEAQTVSLKDYVGRMKEGQDAIYYVTAESFNAARHSPHLEIFRKKGVEVLLLSDRIDEWLVTHLTEFEGKSLQSVAKGDLDLGRFEDAAEKQAHAQAAEQAAPLVERLKQALDGQVKDVRLTHRLTDSPACLVADAHDLSGNLERILKSIGQKGSGAKPILEVNPAHALVVRLKDVGDEAQFGDWARLLLDQALLAEGGQLDDPGEFVRRMNRLLGTLAA